MEIKCIVAATTAGDERDLFFCKVECTQDEYYNGDHYEAAKEAAENEGYDPSLVFDEQDPGGRAMLQLCEWESIPVVQCQPEDGPTP